MKFSEQNYKDYILSELPNFRSRIENYHSNFKDQPWRNPTLCGELMELVDFYEDLKENERENIEEIKKVFIIAEELAYQGNEEIRGALEVCFFESIINSLGTDEKALSEFFKLLGPASIELCKKNDAFWGTRTPGLYGSDH
ncbi:hypothetical protein IM40_10320 (plasmid) [Candidatus Paracaedimonas acanthamoebae]|nr:hypothetical protein IM40_10320 [Candidatus Paracaedimonas acanthamoebae]